MPYWDSSPCSAYRLQASASSSALTSYSNQHSPRLRIAPLFLPRLVPNPYVASVPRSYQTSVSTHARLPGHSSPVLSLSGFQRLSPPTSGWPSRLRLPFAAVLTCRTRGLLQPPRQTRKSCVFNILRFGTKIAYGPKSRTFYAVGVNFLRGRAPND